MCTLTLLRIYVNKVEICRVANVSVNMSLPDLIETRQKYFSTLSINYWTHILLLSL